MIDIRIPYKKDKLLGQAYNEAMETVKDWCLFIDHDVLMVNPLWYDMCCDAIDKIGYKAGWITATTNRIGCHWQQAGNYGIPVNKEEDDIKYHITLSKLIYTKNGNDIYEPGPYAPFSGFFILTHKAAWEAAGGFADKWNCDNNYDLAIQKAGYGRYVMTGLYCYHLYTGKGIWNE
jgi:glycosyltransferase involved in cell wall biosynthesis